MTYFTAEDMWQRIGDSKKFVHAIELVGEPKTFGHILINNELKIGIYINNVDEIMAELERYMAYF